jgi:hypothetical protein
MIILQLLTMLDRQLAKTVSITYVDPEGEETTVKAEIGQNLLDVAHDNDVELEGEPYFSKS